MDQLILTERRENYAILTLNRPEKANAVNVAMVDQFVAALRDLEDAGVIVLAAAGDRSFCAGVDQKERGASRGWATSLGAGRGQFWLEANEVLKNHPAVVISAVKGVALGGGLTLVNNSELVVAATTAQFGAPELGFGHFPALSGPTTIKRLLPKHAAQAILLADRIDAATALQWGMVNYVVPPEEVLSTACELADKIGSRDRYALAFIKRALREMFDMPWHTAIDYGAQMSSLVIHTRAAFAEPAE